MLPNWAFSLLFLFFIQSTVTEYCGANRIPFGLEVHKDGRAVLLCSRPSCFEKKYAECDERPLRTSGCHSNTSWVGGFQKTVDASRLYTQCCEYEDLGKYGELMFAKVVVRRGEFFEGEEKTDENEDVYSFDLITNMSVGKDSKGEYYELQIHRFHCGKVPDRDPVWSQKNPWPRWVEKKKEGF